MTDEHFTRPATAIKFHRAEWDGLGGGYDQGAPEHDQGEWYQHRRQHQGAAGHLPGAQPFAQPEEAE